MSKKLNIIEAMKMPIGTEFEVEFDGEKIPGNTMIVSLDFVGTKEYKTIDWKNHPKDSFMRPFDFLINGVFTPIQQPVSFMEAVAKSKTNRFRIKHELLKSHAKSGHTLLTTLAILTRYFNNDQIADIILNGKCYIEESEDLDNERLSQQH